MPCRDCPFMECDCCQTLKRAVEVLGLECENACGWLGFLAERPETAHLNSRVGDLTEKLRADHETARLELEQHQMLHAAAESPQGN